MKAYEQMKKFQSKEMVENDVINEVENLEKKYQNMVDNWNDYSNQAKSRIQELKTAINTKKKEYTYKSDQINVLKKEIEEISSKIQMKQELAQFLSEEYQKIPLNINRNSFINRIAELTNNINKERQNISQYLKDLNEADMKINKYNETIKRVDNELEDILFQDAKNNRKLNDVYAAFIKLREGYSNLQKNIIDNFNKKSKLRELESQVYDYKIKLKSYDMNQLQEQINFLKVL
jgi:chromosome segregation ATPase